MAINVTFRE